MNALRLALPAILFSAVLVFPALGQTMSSGEQAAVQQALNRGQRLHDFDQAAWHATDALMAEAKAQGKLDALPARLGGWIVRDADPQTLEVLFFDKTPDTPRPLYSARMADGRTRVLSSRFLGEDAPAIDATTLRMIRARSAALDAIKDAKLLRCAAGPYNTAVLPPDTPDGPIPVYILSPQSDAGHVPFGGHARIMIGSDGKAGPLHPFTKGCMELPVRGSTGAPEALVATQLLDPVPTELGVFTMLAAGLPLFIATAPDGRLWVIDAPGGRARIELLPKGAQPH